MRKERPERVPGNRLKSWHIQRPPSRRIIRHRVRVRDETSKRRLTFTFTKLDRRESASPPQPTFKLGLRLLSLVRLPTFTQPTHHPRADSIPNPLTSHHNHRSDSRSTRASSRWRPQRMARPLWRRTAQRTEAPRRRMTSTSSPSGADMSISS